MVSLQNKTYYHKPLVSVIIPAFNRGRYIRRAIDSVLSQTYNPYEIIVIDDGSTDDTASVLQPYMEQIQYIYQDNQGVSAARNHGIKIAKGEFVVFLDTDDYFLPEKLSEQVAAFKAIPSLGIVNSGWRLVDEDGKLIKDVKLWNEAPNLNLEGWLFWKPIFPGAMMFRREYLEQVGGFDTNLPQAEDVDLVLRLALIGCNADWLRKTTVCYCIHGGNTVFDGLQQAISLQKVLDKFYNYPNVPRQIRNKERILYYYTFMWTVWHLYRTDFQDHIPEYLKKTLSLSVYYPTIIFVVLDWAEKLYEHCIRDGYRPEELQQFQPYFKKAVESDENHWVQMKNALNFRMDIWQYYLRQDHIQAVRNLSDYKGLTADEIIKRASPVLFVCTNTSVDMVDLFRQDLMDKGLVSKSESYKVTALYLAVFSEAMFGRKWRKAMGCFIPAVRLAVNPRSWPIWFRFFRMAIQNIKISITGIFSSILLLTKRK